MAREVRHHKVRRHSLQKRTETEKLAIEQHGKVNDKIKDKAEKV